MGLSSSQGRLLMLTSRMSDIELAQIMISQRQNLLAWESEKVSKEYNEAVSNYKLTIKVTDTNYAEGYNIEDLNYDNMSKMGYLLTDANNNLYLTKDKDGKWIIPNGTDGKAILTVNETTGKATLGKTEYQVVDFTETAKNTKLLQNMIMNGQMFIFNSKNSQAGISLSTLESDTEIQYVLDTSDDAKAQSKYDYETARIARQDNRLDMDMKQLETQHEAVTKEYDSVKEIINSNIERTFKLFSNG